MSVAVYTRRRTWRCEIDSSTYVRVMLHIAYGPTAHDGTCEATLEDVDVEYLVVELSPGHSLNFMNCERFRQISDEKLAEIEAFVRAELERKDKTWWNLAFN